MSSVVGTVTLAFKPKAASSRVWLFISPHVTSTPRHQPSVLPMGRRENFLHCYPFFCLLTPETFTKCLLWVRGCDRCSWYNGDLMRCFTYLLARMLNRCIVYDCFLPHGHLGTTSAVPHVAPNVLPNHPTSPAPLTIYKDIVIYSVRFYLCMLSTQTPKWVLLISNEMKLCGCCYVKNEGASGLAWCCWLHESLLKEGRAGCV